MGEPDPLVAEFLVESNETLDQLDRDLVALEQQPRDRARLDSVFRGIHTIKGTCGFFGFARLQAVTHVGENLLSRLRDGELVLDPVIATALLALLDAVRGMLGRIETTGAEGDADQQPLIAHLTDLAARPAGGPPADPAPPARKSAEEMAIAYLAEPKPGSAPGTAPPAPPAPPGGVPADSMTGRLSVGDGATVVETSVRVDVGLLDRLMTMVGELVLARNQILQHTTGLKNPALTGTSQRLNQITTELQEGVMKTRMQPIGTVWNRFPRVVRDLARQLGKQVRVEMEGQHTELDRTIIEAIKDPLTHVIRNAVDHGVEPPALRVAAGKPAEGRLLLRAYHEGGQVNIEIADDGGGVRPDKVRDKAVGRGLIDRDQAARMTDRDLAQLVFLPGFSTAEAVSSVSGRGVGMDVVKTNIEKIGGTVDLQSRPGHGTTLRIKIPLTLAIIPALVVTADGDRYCVPQVNLLELVRLDGDQVARRIERVHDVPVYRLRGRLLPLVDLRQSLGLATHDRPDAVNVVVLQADGRPFGMVVDEVNDTEEIVVKPLSKHLKAVPLYAGATIMGDGRAALILDVLGLAQQTGVLAEGRRAGADAAETAAGASGEPVRRLLLARCGTRRVAVPLDLVARLEDIPADAVEDADGREVVQYRGEIMPLVRLGDVIGCHGAGGDPLRVVVYAADGRTVGLAVDEILDVAEVAVAPRPARGRVGVVGSAVIQGRVTDLLDLPAVIHAAVPDLFEEVLA